MLARAQSIQILDLCGIVLPEKPALERRGNERNQGQSKPKS
jgi:hypothetical protein